MIHIYIGVAVLIILGYFILKYLDGGFTFTEEVIHKGNLTNGGTVIGIFYIIKRTYQNGRIKIIRKDV